MFAVGAFKKNNFGAFENNMDCLHLLELLRSLMITLYGPSISTGHGI